MTANTTCIVTGGAGFIGSHLCKVLIEKGYECFALDNLLTGNKKNIEELAAKDNFHYIDLDVSKELPKHVSSQFQNLRYIYHLASPASPKKYQKFSVETMLVNSIGTLNMLRLAKEQNARMLLASTSEIYGDPKIHPQQESYWGNVNPVGIRSCYDESKRFAEALTMEFVRKNDTDARIIRIFNTFGPKMEKDDGRVISNFVNQALENLPITIYGDGSQTRSFCYVDDMVKGIVNSMESSNSKGEVFNLGNPLEKTIVEIADIIIGLTESKSGKSFLPLPADDPHRRKPDIAKAQKSLGWYPQTSLEAGLKKTIEYFRNL